MVVMIAGGGIGGLSLALALARNGVRTRIVEQTARIEAVGAGIQLSPNATHVLIRLGLEQRLRAEAVAPVRAEVRDAASGRLLIVNQLGGEAEARWGAPYWVIGRAALQAALLEAVEASGLVEIELGRRITEVDPAGVTAGCDGLHSAVRQALFGADAPRFTGQTAWRGLAKLDEAGPPVVQVWTGPRRHFVRYPLAPGVMNMVAVTEAGTDDVESWDAEGEGARLATAFADWPEPVRETIAAVERPWRSALYDRPPLPRWSRDRATLLGDAAHPMLPFLAQGAAMAIEDAVVLADLLAKGGEPEAALAAYERARRGRTAKVQAWASRNARLFHLPSPAALGLFAAARVLDRLVGAEPEERFDWLYGFKPGRHPLRRSSRRMPGPRS
jgi:salicylate hydroxylase